MLRRIMIVAGLEMTSSEDEEVMWKVCGRIIASMKAGSLISCDKDTTAP
jgi:hypothetical protein